jgi:hypothetical protein
MPHSSAFFEARLVIRAEQSRYSKSKVARFLEGAGIKKSNMPHGIILPTSFILGSKDPATMPAESSQMKYTNLV